MADSIYLGKKASSFRTSPHFKAYDMVLINLDDKHFVSAPYVTINESTWLSRGLGNGAFKFVYDGAWKLNGSTVTLSTYGLTTYYSSTTAVKAGDTITVQQITSNNVTTVSALMSRSGRCLEMDNPYGTIQMAEDLLDKIYGYEYQPYEAGGAFVNPAAELGDAISAYGVYGGIYSQELTFGRLMSSAISASGEEEIDNEYQFKSAEQRKYTRILADVQSELTIQATQIAAKVEQTGGNSSFSWELKSDYFAVKASGQTMFYVDRSGAQFAGVVKANSIQAGTITIGGQTVNAGYIQGSQIGSGTITGGNIGSSTISGSNIGGYTITTGNTVFGDTHAADIASVTATVSSLIAGGIIASAIKATNASFTYMALNGYDLGFSGQNVIRIM